MNETQLITELLEVCKTMLRLMEGESLDERFGGEVDELRDVISAADNHIILKGKSYGRATGPR